MSKPTDSDYLFGSLNKDYANTVLDIAEIIHPYNDCKYVLVTEFTPKLRNNIYYHPYTYEVDIHKNKRGYFIQWNNFNVYADGKVTKRRNKENE